MIDVERLRADTPGCAGVVHLNNSGSSLPPRPVVDAMVGYLRAEELGGGYEIEEARSGELDAFYHSTARYLGADPADIAFTTGAADAWWRAFTAVPLAAGDRIVVNSAEYVANAFGRLAARELGVETVVVPDDEHGVVDLDALVSVIDERVKLVSFTMISLANGAVQPAAEAAARVRAAGSDAILLLDACQAAGQLPLDVAELGCDFVVYTGRKFVRGPRGSGALWANPEVLDRLGPAVFVDGRSATWTDDDRIEPAPRARRFELFETNFAGKVGLGVATEYMLDVGVAAIAERIDVLAERCRAQLASIDGVTVHDRGLRRCGIVTFTVAGHEPLAVKHTLTREGINVSAPGRTSAQFDLGSRGIDQVVRAGVHAFNTEEEIDRLCDRVAAIRHGEDHR